MSIDPKDFRDEPAKSNPVTPIQYDWKELVRTIKGMLVGDDYEYAEDTLSSILRWVETRKVCTEGQWQAIENIRAKPHQKRSRQSRFRPGW